MAAWAAVYVTIRRAGKASGMTDRLIAIGCADMWQAVAVTAAHYSAGLALTYLPIRFRAAAHLNQCRITTTAALCCIMLLIEDAAMAFRVCVAIQLSSFADPNIMWLGQPKRSAPAAQDAESAQTAPPKKMQCPKRKCQLLGFRETTLRRIAAQTQKAVLDDVKERTGAEAPYQLAVKYQSNARGGAGECTHT